MEGQVEVLVVDPDGVGDATRDAAHALSVPRHESDPVRDEGDQSLVVEPTGGRLEDLEGGVVHRRARRLVAQEGQVLRAKPLGHPSSARATRHSPFRPTCPNTPLLSTVLVDMRFCQRHRLGGPGPTRGGTLPTRIALAAVTVCVLALPGCGGPDDSDGGGDDETFEIEIEGDEIEPNGERVQVEAGEPVRLEVESDRAGEFHVHSSPEQEVAFKRGSSVVPLTVDIPGIVDVEEHETGIVVLQLEVR